MGIPAFYRWLVDRYPLSVVDVIEEIPLFVNGVTIPVDTSKPNPNGMEFDNLYLDMNGIIHPCFHPENKPPPKNYEEVFKAVFEYIDRIFAMIRPRKLLYMAIDGVAPRAKMNQQRARRFRAARDAADAVAEAEKLRSAFELEGEKLAHLEKTNLLDSNVITPGTEFMAMLSSALHYYIHLRLNMDPGWRGIKVILSDANVPGEGEHKIISYIRLQRNLPGFDSNTRHCLYGLDADLIMLALATHEPHFAILREDVRTLHQNDKSQKSGKGVTRTVREQGSQEIKKDENAGAVVIDNASRQNFQFLNIWVLRDYLEHDLRIPGSKVKIDLERLVDDFVFMCLFVGNDFLPHMPSLEISEGAIDLLMTVYKKEFVRMGGYLTNSFEVDLGHVEHFIQAVGSYENAIFRRRRQLQMEREARNQHVMNSKLGKGNGPSTRQHVEQKMELKSSMNGFRHSVSNNSESNLAAVDKIMLGEEGWKERYYTEKFDVKTEEDHKRLRRYAVLKYTEGICWFMHYYYQGVCSWQWFYPYHYAPFASDFCGLDQLEIHFTLGDPFKPFDQLMGVLPAASAHALPFYYRKLMTDLSSPIADFYPKDFELDMNGKRYAWQAICKLPFIKESRLLTEIAKVEDTLTDEEKQRNSLGLDVLFVHMSHPIAAKIMSAYRRQKHHPKLLKAKIKKKIDPSISEGMNGYMYISDKTACQLEICSPIGGMKNVAKNQVITVFYKYPPIHPHNPRPPKGVIMPGKLVSKRDVLPMPVLWHERRAVFGRVFSGRRVPNSISGPHLGRLARSLVSKHCLDNRTSCIEHECTTKVLPSVRKEPFDKNKEDNGNGSCINGLGKELKRGESDSKRKKRRKKSRCPTEALPSCKKGPFGEKEAMNGDGNCINGTPKKRKWGDNGGKSKKSKRQKRPSPKA